MPMKIAALIAFAAVAFAQDPRPGRGAGRGRPEFDSAMAAGPFDAGATILRAGVRNAPFSADVVTESIHTLADGNRIRQSVTSKVFRDSDGRTRREQSVNLGGLAPDAGLQQMVFIHDPVSGRSYSLNAKDRTGMRIERSASPRGPQRMDPGRGHGFGPAGPASPAMRGGPMGGLEPKLENLGRQTIDGVAAEGRRTTLTIPAGRAGNDLPIHIVLESWYSSELQATVLSKHSDPRTGETITRLANINRAEPAHALFEPPADYRLTDSGVSPMRPRGGQPARQ
jgi:hypothetical protein